MERQEVLLQKLENWCAASTRALADQAFIQFRGHHLLVNNQVVRLHAPYLRLDFSTHDSRKLRGIADGIALRLRHSNQKLHDSLKPDTDIEHLIFELLEQLRCESLVPKELPGQKSNLATRFLFWATKVAASPLVDNSIGLLLFTVHLVGWSRLHKQPIPKTLEELTEATRWGFNDEIRDHLYCLTKLTNKQAEFAQHALAIAQQVQKMIDLASPSNNDDSELKSTLLSLNVYKQFSLQWLESDSANVSNNSQGTDHMQCPDDSKGMQGLLSPSDYRVFSRAYDKEVNATKLVRAAQLQKLRKQLDKCVQDQKVNCHRVARYLKQLGLAPSLAGWSFGEEEGYLDSARLARIITSPQDHRLYRREQVKPLSNCIVSFLIDNSGSMTQHGNAIAAMIDTFVKVLEMAAIKTEVLGFTTNEWNGGIVREQWIAAGKPKQPGRLNSICHTVYKTADTSWRRARPAIAALLRTDLFREGVGGEALQWAVQRIEHRQEHKKIVVLLSDGSPMETATMAANSEHYLDQHLKLVADNIEQRPDIGLCALGVGFNLGNYVKQSLSIDLEEPLTSRDYFAFADLLKRAS